MSRPSRMIALTLPLVLTLLALAGAAPASAAPATYSVSGRATLDAEGNPPVSAGVQVTAEGASWSQSQTAYTAADGTFVFPALPEGSYYFTFTPPRQDAFPFWVWTPGGIGTQSRPEAPEPVSSNRSDINVVIGGGAGVEGTVSTSDGAPLPNVGIQALAVRPGGAGGQTYGLYYYTYTDADGRYKLRGLPTGWEYDLTFTRGDYAMAKPYGGSIMHWAGYVDVSSGTRQLVDVTMYRTSSISGQISGAVQLSQGTWQAYLWMYADWLDDWIQIDVKNVNSGYSFADLPPGYYAVDLGVLDTEVYVVKSSPTFELGEDDDRQWNAAVTYTGTPGTDPRNGAFVRALYEDFLDREPSGGEIANWSQAISRGFPRGSIASGFVNSDEYRLIRIDAAYRGILGRESEVSGRMGWLDGMKRGVLSTDDIEKALYVSEEYVQQQCFNSSCGTEINYVRGLYLDLLGRAASNTEAQGWATSLRDQRYQRSDLVNVMWRSLETARQRVSLMYQKYLGRVPEYSAVVQWGDYNLANGDSASRSAITGSEEYYVRASNRFIIV